MLQLRLGREQGVHQTEQKQHHLGELHAEDARGDAPFRRQHPARVRQGLRGGHARNGLGTQLS